MTIAQALKHYNTLVKNSDGAYHYDYSKAVELLKNAEGVEKENPIVQNYLGECYYYGRGVRKNIAAATKYFKKSAENNYYKAHYNIGMMYEKNEMVNNERTNNNSSVVNVHKYVDAYDSYEKSRVLEPSFMPAYIKKGDIIGFFQLHMFKHDDKIAPPIQNMLTYYMEAIQHDSPEGYYRVANILNNTFYDDDEYSDVKIIAKVVGAIVIPDETLSMALEEELVKIEFSPEPDPLILYLKAIDKGMLTALKHIAILYYTRSNFTEMVWWYWWTVYYYKKTSPQIENLIQVDPKLSRIYKELDAYAKKHYYNVTRSPTDDRVYEEVYKKWFLSALKTYNRKKNKLDSDSSRSASSSKSSPKSPSTPANSSSPKSPKIIGQGTTGCVIKPSLKCDKTIYPYNAAYVGKKVSKLIIDDDDFKTEIELNKKIHGIDKTGKYFIVPVSACTANVNNVNKGVIITNCKMITAIRPSGNINHIVMPDGGVNMLQYVLELGLGKLSLKNWILMMENVIHGIVRLQQSKICHFDIKPENIVYDGKKIRLVDFGLSDPFDKLYIYDIIAAREGYEISTRTDNFVNYALWPIEIYAYKYGRTFKNTPINAQEFYRHFRHKINESPTEPPYPLNSAVNYVQLLRNVYSNDDQLQTASKDLVDAFNTDPDLRITLKKPEVMEKIDVYSLGISCIWLHEYLDLDGADVSLKNAYIKFVSKMMHFDYRKRLSVKEMVTMYNSLKDKL